MTFNQLILILSLLLISTGAISAQFVEGYIINNDGVAFDGYIEKVDLSGVRSQSVYFKHTLTGEVKEYNPSNISEYGVREVVKIVSRELTASDVQKLSIKKASNKYFLKAIIPVSYTHLTLPTTSRV